MTYTKLGKFHLSWTWQNIQSNLHSVAFGPLQGNTHCSRNIPVNTQSYFVVYKPSMTGYRVNLEENLIQYDFEKGVLLNNS